MFSRLLSGKPGVVQVRFRRPHAAQGKRNATAVIDSKLRIVFSINCTVARRRRFEYPLTVRSRFRFETGISASFEPQSRISGITGKALFLATACFL